MARLGIVFGLLLCALTVTGLVISPLKSPSQFFPMTFGIPVLFCGVVALNPHRCRHAMQAALALAAVGALIAGGRTIATAIHWADGGETNSLAFAMVAAMAVICGVFLVVGTISLLRGRRQKSGGRVTGRPHQPSAREGSGAMNPRAAAGECD